MDIKLDKKWLQSNWKTYENKTNQCLYICIDRPSNKWGMIWLTIVIMILRISDIGLSNLAFGYGYILSVTYGVYFAGISGLGWRVIAKGNVSSSAAGLVSWYSAHSFPFIVLHEFFNGLFESFYLLYVYSVHVVPLIFLFVLKLR